MNQPLLAESLDKPVPGLVVEWRADIVERAARILDRQPMGRPRLGEQSQQPPAIGPD
jgi:hypothetical protein